MKIPEKIRIGSMDYKVLLTDKMIVRDGVQCYGCIDSEEHVIEIDRTARDIQGQEQTFLHEVVHGIMLDRNINLTDYPDEETIVNEIAKGLHQVIRDNPEIFK